MDEQSPGLNWGYSHFKTAYSQLSGLVGQRNVKRRRRKKGKRKVYTRKRSKTQGCVSVCRNLDDTNAMERRMKRRERERERERERRGSTRVKSKKGEEEVKGEDRVMYCGKCLLKTMSCNKRSRLLWVKRETLVRNNMNAITSIRGDSGNGRMNFRVVFYLSRGWKNVVRFYKNSFMKMLSDADAGIPRMRGWCIVQFRLDYIFVCTQCWWG